MEHQARPASTVSVTIRHMSEASAAELEPLEGRPLPPDPPAKKRYSRSFLAVARGEIGLPPASKVGRPSKLTPALATAILSAIAKGSHFHPACAAAGVSGTTASRWIESGSRDLEAGLRSDFAQFVEGLQQACALAETSLGTKIYSQAEIDWRAGAFLLERRFPDRWGKKEQAQNITNVVISDALVSQLVDSMRVAGAPALELQRAIDVASLPQQQLPSAPSPKEKRTPKKPSAKAPQP